MNREQTVEKSGGGRLSDLAYTRILEGLFDRRLTTGAFVSQKELVHLLDVPVGPLRDALRVLEAEGILKIHPRSGIEFVKIGLELTRSTYQFRTIIERPAVRVFAETASDEELASIARQHEAVLAELDGGQFTPEMAAELDNLENILHNTIVSSLTNPLIDTAYRRLHNYLRLVRLDTRMTAPLARRSLREHMEIIEACQTRDPDAAETALQAHFSAALQRHMGLY